MTQTPSEDQLSGPVESEAAKPKFDRAYELAAGMMRQDGRFLLVLYGMFLIPELTLFFVDQPLGATLLSVQVIAKAVELVGLYTVSRRWVLRLSRADKKTMDAASLGRMLLLGFSFWLLLAFPLFLTRVLAPEIQALALMLLIPGALIALRYYFFFFPVALHQRPIPRILAQANRFTESHRWVAFRALASPAGAMMILQSLLLSLSPDGRDLGIIVLVHLCGGIYPLLKIYLALGFALHLLGNIEWDEQGLDPYRDARMETLAFTAPDWLTILLRPKTGVTLVLMSAFIWLANQSRTMTLPPSAELTLEEIRIEGSRVRLKLHAVDERFQFRGFEPYWFNLSGEAGLPIAERTTQVLIDGEPVGPVHFFRGVRANEMNLTLEFETDRTAKELRALEDLYLWYRRARLLYLPMKDAVVEPAPENNGREAEQTERRVTGPRASNREAPRPR